MFKLLGPPRGGPFMNADGSCESRHPVENARRDRLKPDRVTAFYLMLMTGMSQITRAPFNPSTSTIALGPSAFNLFL
jgi:hypothetical protein